jgi:hypothetical protein
MSGTRPSKWKPGQSGNPGGRRKTDATIKLNSPAPQLADAIRTLATICWCDPTAAPAPRVAAAMALLDRGWGKAMQPTDVTSNGDSVRFVIMSVPEAENTEEWLEHYAPKLISSGE